MHFIPSDFLHEVWHANPQPASPQARAQALPLSTVSEMLRQLIVFVTAQSYSCWDQAVQVRDLREKVHAVVTFTAAH